MAPRPELFAGLFGTALLVTLAGVAVALGRDMPAGTMAAGAAATAAGVAFWAMLSLAPVDRPAPPPVRRGASVSDPTPVLPPQPRTHPLARLEAEIAAQELACARWGTWAASLEAAGRDSRRPRALLGVAEERLAWLVRSREVLLRGEEGHEGNEPGSPAAG